MPLDLYRIVASERLRSLARKLARSVLRSFARGNENSRGRVFHIGNVPDAGRVDDILTRAELHIRSAPIGEFLVKNHFARRADNQFIAEWVHFPTRPVFRKRMLAYQPSFASVGSMSLSVSGVPVHTPFEGRLGNGGSPQAQVYESVGEARLLVVHATFSIVNALSLLPSGSRK